MIQGGSPVWWPRYIREGLWSGKQFRISRQMVSHGSSGNFATIVSTVCRQWTGNNSFEERAGYLWVTKALEVFLPLVPWVPAGYHDVPVRSQAILRKLEMEANYKSCILYVNAVRTDSGLKCHKEANKLRLPTVELNSGF